MAEWSPVADSLWLLVNSCSGPHKSSTAAQPSPQCQNILSSDEAESKDFNYGLPPASGNPFKRCVTGSGGLGRIAY